MTKYSALILIFLVACKQGPKTTPQQTVYSPEVEARIDRVIHSLQVDTPVNNVFRTATLDEQLKAYHTPGLSIAVINDGKVEWARGFGIRNEKTGEPVDAETLFQAGSVSKPTFALAVMKLREKGSVDLDKDINEYLKSWKIPANDGWQPRITLRMLLSHTAGLTVHGFPGYKKSEPVPTVPQLLSGEYPSNTRAVLVNILPGTMFRYAGGGTTVAQLAITDLIGKPFPQIIREELFTPLMLKHSTYQQPLPDSLEAIASTAFPWKGEPIEGRFHTYPEMAAAGLWTNPTELATCLIEVQKALHGESNFLMKETIEEMLTPQKVASHIGIGYFLEGKGDSARFRHGGWDEGFVTEAVAYKYIGKGAVIMVNSNEGVDIQDEILRAIAREYQWPDFLPASRKESAFTDDELKNLPGSYADETYEMTIEKTADGLALVYLQQSAVALQKRDDGTLGSRHLNFKLIPGKGTIQFEQMGRQFTLKKK